MVEIGGIVLSLARVTSVDVGIVELRTSGISCTLGRMGRERSLSD